MSNVKSDHFYFDCWFVFQPDEVDWNEILARPQSAPAEQEDGELRDGGRDDDGEADGAVAVVREESHQKPEPRKEHDVDIDDHWGDVWLHYKGLWEAGILLGYCCKMLFNSVFLILLSRLAESAEASYLDISSSFNFAFCDEIFAINSPDHDTIEHCHYHLQQSGQHGELHLSCLLGHSLACNYWLSESGEDHQSTRIVKTQHG